jgi:C4-dicarboxylate-specific signal transduction histidine kinase
MMDTNTILLVLAAVACPIVMGFMMWTMMRDTSRQSKEPTSEQPLSVNTAERLAVLRQQRQALEAEIAEATRIAELEAMREQLVSDTRLASDRYHSDTVGQEKSA